MACNVSPGSAVSWGVILALLCSSAAEAVTREEAVSYLATCEKVWYNQAYLCKMRAAKYESIETIENNKIISQSLKLLALCNGLFADETLADTVRDGQWRRRREIFSFDGKLAFRWSEWDNLGTVSPGTPAGVFRYPEDLPNYYGFQLERPVSALIRDANEFAWGGTETIGEAECVKADCVFRSPDSKAAQKTRFELRLATQGALYPMRIIRWIDRGEGEKMTGLWETRAVDKDPKTNIWQLREGRFYNLGPMTVHTLEVLKRLPISAELAKPENFMLRFPPDSKVLDVRSGKSLNAENYRNGVVHPKNSFLPAFIGLTVEQAEAALNQVYRNNWTPPWASDFGEKASKSNP